MGDAINLTDNLELITDCCRYSEGLLSEAAVRKKYRFDEATWKRLGEDEGFIEAIELEKTRRVRSGAAKREKAQALVVQACDVLGEIMRDADASPKHRIDASKALDAFADNGPERAPASDERFTISIILSADEKLVVDKKRGKIDPHDAEIIDHDDHDDDTTPLLAAIAANKRTDDGNGDPI